MDFNQLPGAKEEPKAAENPLPKSESKVRQQANPEVLALADKAHDIEVAGSHFGAISGTTKELYDGGKNNPLFSIRKSQMVAQYEEACRLLGRKLPNFRAFQMEGGFGAQMEELKKATTYKEAKGPLEQLQRTAPSVAGAFKFITTPLYQAEAAAKTAQKDTAPALANKSRDILAASYLVGGILTGIETLDKGGEHYFEIEKPRIIRQYEEMYGLIEKDLPNFERWQMEGGFGAQMEELKKATTYKEAKGILKDLIIDAKSVAAAFRLVGKALYDTENEGRARAGA